ncbi:GNAT family N-acetyltransferase [Escherichia coli]|nr:GNAT family N-acetyltransferase [Escherichia coli]
MFQLTPFNSTYDRTSFLCGSDALDRYIKEHVTQDIRRRIAACFVAVDNDHNIIGYYTLSAASILLTDLPEHLRKKFPRDPTIPAIRMGRLAVSLSSKGTGLGGALLADALYRAYTSEIAAYALIVDVKDDTAVAFYKHYGFMAFPESGRTLFMPLASLSTIK